METQVRNFAGNLMEKLRRKILDEKNSSLEMLSHLLAIKTSR